MTAVHTDLQSFLVAAREAPADAPATLAAALVVSPEGFGVAAESRADNVYMADNGEVDAAAALRQHHALVDAFHAVDLPVLAVPGRWDCPEGVFVNNAFSTAPGRLVIGAMRHAVRRAETRREDVRQLFGKTLGREVIDLSVAKPPCVAELTGPLVLDRARRIGFCGMTDRVDDLGCERMAEAFNLRAVFRFPLIAAEYHTNVVLSVLAGRAAVICPESFESEADWRAIAAYYAPHVAVISTAERDAFVANCLAVTERDVFMSTTADEALTDENRTVLTRAGFRIHAVDVSEFEKGGGSVRCLIGEVF